jgi:hypothetical protein
MCHTLDWGERRSAHAMQRIRDGGGSSVSDFVHPEHHIAKLVGALVSSIPRQASPTTHIAPSSGGREFPLRQHSSSLADMVALIQDRTRFEG